MFRLKSPGRPHGKHFLTIAEAGFSYHLTHGQSVPVLSLLVFKTATPLKPLCQFTSTGENARSERETRTQSCVL